ncbi:M12 family metallo-peptidase [Candidatus Uabimicrobium amorphum]|uniref:Peptidyl-Asp metalloendopeptidase n=1 Tax=Uabimicrobium amorphum TaxID=2596890 RepID=A0A5S9IMX0_UABAM|nr:M12 family metallo-peptidase [Candidatus Uabimicrobium amorphum]BBM84853.1 peptidyl-Asp metalloendopeptidase [Candidatus Uabimicrobium amorphum]
MRIFVLLVLCMCSLCFADNLFIDSSRDAQALTVEQQQLVNTIWQRQTTLNARTTEVDFKVLEGQIEIDLNLFPGKQIKVLRTEMERSRSGYVWNGIVTEGYGTATIVVEGDMATGTISQDDEVYRISPLGNGMHAISQIDSRMFPMEHPPLEENVFVEEVEEQREETQQSDSRAKTIDILVAYTPSAASTSGNISSLIKLAVTESNQSYRNSGIDIKLRLVHTYRTNYRESGDFNTDLSRFRNKNDGHMDEVHSRRDQHRADICVLIVNNKQYCGLAYVYASAQSAFAAVHYDCATGYYSFAHEIGHLQGARHNPENDSSSQPFAYGHGYQDPGRKWRTIMAYNCPGGCKRINHWSNPAKKNSGKVMGTSSRHNNARVLNTSANRMSSFR